MSNNRMIQAGHVLLTVCVLALSCKKSSGTSGSGSGGTPNVVIDTSAAADTLVFSGYTWYVKNYRTSTAGPGPNYWNQANAWVDANGWLHLKLSKDATTGNWDCAEVYSAESLGLGEYQWEVEGRLDSLDQNVVLGLFNYSGNDGYDEMDIEFSRWGVSTNPDLNYTIYPATGSNTNTLYHTVYNDTLTDGTYTTQRFTRYSDSVVFQALNGFQGGNTGLSDTSACRSPAYSISTGSMPVHMNLWLYKGAAPSNGDSVEIVIHSFTFTGS